jgi:hypothetical protein
VQATVQADTRLLLKTEMPGTAFGAKPGMKIIVGNTNLS